MALDQDLNTLQRVDVIHELAGTPELEYALRLTLAREAAYHSILRRHRRQFHRRVGEAMERLYHDQREEHAAVLAYPLGHNTRNRTALSTRLF